MALSRRNSTGTSLLKIYKRLFKNLYPLRRRTSRLEPSWKSQVSESQSQTQLLFTNPGSNALLDQDVYAREWKLRRFTTHQSERDTNWARVLSGTIPQPEGTSGLGLNKIRTGERHTRRSEG
ncbi:unnamed protein product [Dovyalis caffra]|uniref:Uncharacterized protein n=1 Tax=Dovyalis caffra TaxID=77055 RepID=A0AAV1SCC8_9ROSI|nr:unnamed protein product [Dovyalis caffra]